MYESFYGLRENPFNLTPDPRYLFLSHSHREALGHLSYGVEQKKGFILITGGIGTGKTTLCRTFLRELPEPVQSALIFNPVVEEKELLQSINQELGISYKGLNRKELLDALNDQLIQQYSRGSTTVLIIDEAQNLDVPMLEKIRTLSNLETNEEKLVQIVLVGQPELEEILRMRNCRQINERIAVRCRIRPLSADDMAPYIYHRLSTAGGRGDLRFTGDALKMIHQATLGIPRRINILCDRALLIAYTREIWCIDDKIICKARDETLNHLDKPMAKPAVKMAANNARPAVVWAALAALLLTMMGILAGRIVVEWKPAISSHGEATAQSGGPAQIINSRAVLSRPLEKSEPEAHRLIPLAAQAVSADIIPGGGAAEEDISLPQATGAGFTKEGAEKEKTLLSSVFPGDFSTLPAILSETTRSDSLQSQESGETSDIQRVKSYSDSVDWAGVLDLDGAIQALTKAWPVPARGKSDAGSGDSAVPRAFHSWSGDRGVLAMSFFMGYKHIRRFRLPFVLKVQSAGSSENSYLVIDSMDDDGYTYVMPDGRKQRAPRDNLGRIWSGSTIIFPPALPDERPFTMGVKGKDVRTLQARLQRLGYPVEEVDGRFGPVTRKAFKQFQKDFNLEPDGIPGPRSMAVLYQLEKHGIDTAGYVNKAEIIEKKPENRLE